MENKYPDDIQEFYNLLIDDYYLLFLTENLKDIKDEYKKINDYKSLLKLMINSRFTLNPSNQDIENIEYISKQIVWMESNNQYISILLNIFQAISLYKNNLFTKINEMIQAREITFHENEEINQHHILEIKAPFYYINEALLRISFDYSWICKLEEQQFHDYIKILKKFLEDSLIIIEDFSFCSNQFFIIQNFLKIVEILNKIKKGNIEKIKKVLELLSDIKHNIRQLYNFLINNLGKTEEFGKLIMDIFIVELKKERNDNIYKQTLIDIILNNDILIINSRRFMSLFFEEIITSKIPLFKENITNIIQDDNNYLELINKSNNCFLNEILLIIFEIIINIYFNSISDLSPRNLEFYFEKYYHERENNNDKINPTLILSDTSLDIFDECVGLLQRIYRNKYEAKAKTLVIKNELICQLYAIAYIKIYLFKYIHFYHYYYNNPGFPYFCQILNILNGTAKEGLRQVIKIYILKILFYILGNYNDLVEHYKKNKETLFLEEFAERFNEEKEKLLSFYMLPNVNEKKFKIFKDAFQKFSIYKLSDFNKPVEEFVDFITNYGLDDFYLISTNLMISNLFYKTDLLKFSRYSNYILELLNNIKINIPEITKKLFLLFSNKITFNKVILKKMTEEQNLKTINPVHFEILLYGLRFCLQSSNIKNDNPFLYSKLISPDCNKILNENSIPGNNTLDNFYVNNYILLENHLIKENKPSNIGAYICSCGLYYEINPCSFPIKQKICMNCGKIVGSCRKKSLLSSVYNWEKTLVPGHYRIFKDLDQKKYEFSKNGGNDKNIPNMLIDDYKKLKIEPILEKEKFGINKVSKTVFEDPNKKVRNLSSIGYRLLNFILYSHLFYANCLGFISNDDLSKYLCDKMTCIQMLEIDWNLLKDALKSKGISKIEIFINLIFNKLSEKIKNCKEIKSIKDQEKFEEEIENLLNESYKDYEVYSEQYIKNNELLMLLGTNSIKPLILEILDAKEYNEREYPFYQYFLMTTYPTKDHFIQEFKKVDQYETKFPIISNYINENDPKKYLIKYLPEFNKFSNYMINYYSYKISRKDAAIRRINKEYLYEDNIDQFRQKFKTFITIWDKLRPFAVKYLRYEEMPPAYLRESSSIAYFLNDKGDFGKGMYIAAAYEIFINAQNNFLDSLINNLEKNNISNHFAEKIKNKIDIQKAKEYQILNFGKDKDLIKFIYNNYGRNIFGKYTINYRNYKKIIYDFDAIEKFMEGILLHEKVKFNSSENLTFVTFQFEGFSYNKSSIFADFYEKYKQVPLSLENKKIIYKIIKREYSDEKHKLLNVLFSLQSLLFHLTQEREWEKEEIKNIINTLSDRIFLSNECIEIFNHLELKLKLEELIGVYSFFELLCFDSIEYNLPDHYKIKIDEKTKEKILNLFEKNSFKIITKKTLTSACRKLISRYLIASEYNESNYLVHYLKIIEFWTKEILNDEEALEHDFILLSNTYLTIGQCFELYNLLIEDKNEEFKEFDDCDNCKEDEENYTYKRMKRRKKFFDY